MLLETFDPARAELVASWAVGDEVVRAWCARDEGTVPADVVAGWSQADDVEAYLFRDESGEPVAYGELWLDDDEGDVELARLLVAPEHRGRGVGRALTRALSDRAQLTHPELPAVFLRVRPRTCRRSAPTRQPASRRSRTTSRPPGTRASASPTTGWCCPPEDRTLTPQG